MSVRVLPVTESGVRMMNVTPSTLTQTVFCGSGPGIVTVRVVVPPTGRATILMLKKPYGKL